MDRREYLATIGVIGFGSLAGCTGNADDASGEPTDTTRDSTEEPTTEGTTGEPTTAESTNEETTTEDSTTADPTTEESRPPETVYTVRVQYDGEWSGSVGGDGSIRSVDGTGTATFDIEGDPLVVSANAQKQDGSSDTLTIQILEDGELIAERSTSAEYGVAQVTSEGGTGDGSDDSNSDESGSETAFSVRVQYSGSWQGTIGTGGSTRTVDGSGTESFDIEGSPDIISANAQKEDDSSDELIVQILEDGDVVEESSTSAEFGMVQITYSNF